MCSSRGIKRQGGLVRKAGYTDLAFRECFLQKKKKTPRNTKHLLYTFRISCEFRVLLMPQKINHEILRVFPRMPTLEPAIYLLSNWWECEKMLVKQEKWEVYRWHFVNYPVNHFSHLALRHSRQEIGIFTKHQRERYGKFLVKFLA